MSALIGTIVAFIVSALAIFGIIHAPATPSTSQIDPMQVAQHVKNRTVSTTINGDQVELSIERCADISCFGSGRTDAETQNGVTVYNLVSKDCPNYGVIEHDPEGEKFFHVQANWSYNCRALIYSLVKSSLFDSRELFKQSIRIEKSAFTTGPAEDWLTIASPVDDGGVPLSEPRTDLSGWSVRSAVSGKSFTIQKMPIPLGHGWDALFIHTVGPSSENRSMEGEIHQYFGESTIAWGAHDTIQLLDPLGTVIDTYSY